MEQVCTKMESVAPKHVVEGFMQRLSDIESVEKDTVVTSQCRQYLEEAQSLGTSVRWMDILIASFHLNKGILVREPCTTTSASTSTTAKSTSTTTPSSSSTSTSTPKMNASNPAPSMGLETKTENVSATVNKTVVSGQDKIAEKEDEDDALQEIESMLADMCKADLATLDSECEQHDHSTVLI